MAGNIFSLPLSLISASLCVRKKDKAVIFNAIIIARERERERERRKKKSTRDNTYTYSVYFTQLPTDSCDIVKPLYFTLKPNRVCVS